MFVAARAWVEACKNGGQYIEPTWRKFSIGPWLRRERDKRVYNRLFKSVGISGLRKLAIIKFSKDMSIHEGLGKYFTDFNCEVPLVLDLIRRLTDENVIAAVPLEKEMGCCVGLHIRLGDYLPELRVSIDWYKGVIMRITELNKEQKFLIFSDGTDEELAELLALPNVERVFYGNAFADMIGLSRCKLVVASDSTFSAWSAFIGQKPVIFSKRHFPKVYADDTPECVLGDSCEIPTTYIDIISNQ